MANSLTIISKKEREELYKNLEGKWLIELDGRKMNNWDDFYYQIMPQIDFYGYSKKFEVSWHTVKDAALEFEVIEKYLQDNNYNGIAIVYKYPNFEMDMKEVQLAEEFINQIDENLDFEEENDYVLIFTNSYDFVQGIHYHECCLMLIKLIEDILLKIRKKIKIYLLGNS